MKKLEILCNKKEVVSKIDLDIPETDEDFEVGIAYIDLKQIQSINSANDTWNGRKIFFAYLSATSYTIIGDMDKLAEEIEKVKTLSILGVN